MSGKKDILLIAAVLALAAVMFGVSKVMPKTDLSQKVADETLAPDAVEYLDATPQPAAEVPAENETETAAPAVTEAPKAQQAAAPCLKSRWLPAKCCRM